MQYANEGQSEGNQYCKKKSFKNVRFNPLHLSIYFHGSGIITCHYIIYRIKIFHLEPYFHKSVVFPINISLIIEREYDIGKKYIFDLTKK